MRFVANTDALIIDLTENGGGYSPTDSYLGSYFFDEESVLWSSSYTRPTGETETEHTFKDVGGERYLNKPVFILVSERTFSLGEQFAYCMKHFNKAKIVGQTSAGAAHGIDYIEVNDNFMIQLPLTHNIHPVTKTDWEGTGVIPNINTNSNSQAIKTAHLNALNIQIESLKKQTIVGPILKRYNKIKAEINNH
ncbi:S41 family peptidase [Aquimarina macrocephali]|uniref:S41 family peptidase n=1 Tax=Aquimarina macrocephali TaxID=666563 RepID=UPI003F660E08